MSQTKIILSCLCCRGNHTQPSHSKMLAPYEIRPHSGVKVAS